MMMLSSRSNNWQTLITRRSMGMGGGRAWAVGGVRHTEEFCVKVLKFEIVNSRKLFNYFSGVVP